MSDRSTLMAREPRESERAWIAEQLQGWWGSTLIVSATGAWETTRLQTLVAAEQDDLVGVATFEVSGAACHLVTLNAVEPARGAGSALLARVVVQPRTQVATVCG